MSLEGKPEAEGTTKAVNVALGMKYFLGKESVISGSYPLEY